MRFTAQPRGTTYQPTPRKIAAWERRKINERAALPLLADHIAERQLSADDEMARRGRQWDSSRARMRDFRATAWRRTRARYYDLPQHVRDAVRDEWSRWRGPLEATYLSSTIRNVSRRFTAGPDDFPWLSVSARAEKTAALNELARRDAPWANAEWQRSQGVLRLLAPGFEPTSRRPLVHEHEGNAARAVELIHAIVAYADFPSNVDPRGERDAGVLMFHGVEVVWRIVYRRADGAGRSDCPWNVDLTRRVLLISTAAEDEIRAPVALSPASQEPRP